MSATLTALAVAGALCATQGGEGTPYAAGVNCRTIQVDGHPRQYLVYVPRRHAARAPVVFMFHGSSGNGARFLRISGWREQADRTGLIAVFPTGLRYRMLDTGRRITKWNGYNLAANVDLNDKPPGYPAERRGRRTTSASWTRCWATSARWPTRGASTRRASRTAPSSPPAWRSSAPTCSPRPRTRPAASTRRARGRRGQIPLYMTVGSEDDRIGALPMDPFGLLQVPLVGTMVDATLDTLGVAAAAVRRRLAPPLDRVALAGPRAGVPLHRARGARPPLPGRGGARVLALLQGVVVDKVNVSVLL